MAPPRSKLWTYFKKIDSQTATCRSCLKVIKTSGNTSNLHKHLKNHNFATASASNSNSKENAGASGSSIIIPRASTSGSTGATTTVLPTCQSQTLDTCIKKIKSYEDGGNRHACITNSVIYFICADNQPFNAVEGKGFKHLLREIAPLYKVPSRETVKSKIDGKFELLRELYKDKFVNISNFCITTDIWSEMMSARSFLGVTVHFLDENKLQLNSMNIETYELSESHTSDYIGQKFMEVLEKWAIQKTKIAAVITDNGSNMVNAINQHFDKNTHIPCFAHTLNLVVENSIKSVKELQVLLDKVRSIVKYIKSSVNASDDLRKKQVNSGISESKVKKLVLDVKTRWNSTFYMLERFVELVGIVNEILLLRPKAPPLPTAVELLLVKEVVHLLRPLECATREASGDLYITISKIIPLVNCITNDYERVNVEHDVSIHLKSALLQEFRKRFGRIEFVKTIAIATLLDPRFKNIHFQDPLAVASAMSELRKIMKSEAIEGSNSDSSSSEQGEGESKELYDLWSHHKELAHRRKTTKRRNLGEPVVGGDELSVYISNPVISLKGDPLQAWDEMKMVFPSLYKQAIKYFCIVATSVPAERLFSKAGRTVSQSRNRLIGKRLSQLMFLNSVKEEDWFP